MVNFCLRSVIRWSKLNTTYFQNTDRTSRLASHHALKAPYCLADSRPLPVICPDAHHQLHSPVAPLVRSRIRGGKKTSGRYSTYSYTSLLWILSDVPAPAAVGANILYTYMVHIWSYEHVLVGARLAANAGSVRRLVARKRPTKSVRAFAVAEQYVHLFAPTPASSSQESQPSVVSSRVSSASIQCVSFNQLTTELF